LSRARIIIKKLAPLRLTIIVIAAIVFVYVAWQAFSGMPSDIDFYTHQSRYRNIVAQVKAMPTTSEAYINTWIDDFAVRAKRTPSGAYIIEITTLDMGHAGVYGYVYSDMPLTAHPDSNYEDEPSIDSPGHLTFANEKVKGQDGHWWSVYNNLD